VIREATAEVAGGNGAGVGTNEESAGAEPVAESKGSAR
jgi:hypothetical protein